MNTKKYNWILYLITTTIVVTIAVQLYWNYRNYQENKRRVKNEIQASLDTAIDEYYSGISKNNFFGVFNSDSTRISKNLFTSFWKTDKDSLKGKFHISSLQIKTDNPDEYKKMPRIIDSIFFKDSVFSKLHKGEKIKSNVKIQPFKIIRGQKNTDSIRLAKGIQSIIIALNTDKIDFKVMDSIFSNQLDKKEIGTKHYLTLTQSDSIVGTSFVTGDSLQLYAEAKSTYLRRNQSLRAYYKDPSIAALKRSLGGISISLLLSLVIISTLFYLLKIINKQKELAEIKNDLISNITHEFKTPIATVSTALEAIESFNAIDNKEKTQKYVAMSSDQMKKLNQMVEKLLETATLDSEKLILNKESVDMVSLVEKIVNKHRLIDSSKSVNFTSNMDITETSVDPFHIENAISNLVDNALKYGGDTIEVNVNKLLNQVQITVADNGNGIEKNQIDKVFDKFYRVPKGNTHDVKGFGIGLYYTKKIIEKHQGTISLTSNKGETIFTINLPYEF